ncbi:hypothetical protein NLI96_g12007 [Meripilus lineatus]|uniref:Uncharacterized protein n=1 Tax=Meripilus lineatus TaxID=2056292 RepID=A0AAD5US52_9APHY|nr:hypothetical protein NLI96_g12007 [Physisporinus lineatus]
MSSPEVFTLDQTAITAHSFNANRTELAVSLNSKAAQILTRQGNEWKATETLFEAHALLPSARLTLKGIGGPCLKECVESGPRWEDLELGKKRARLEQIKREQDKQREDDEEVECIAFAEIDWYDYLPSVQAIEFSAADTQSDLSMSAKKTCDADDVEDEKKRKKEEEEERILRREREKVIWDGRTASKASTLVKFSTNVNFDGQIAAIHRSEGLGPSNPRPTHVPPATTSFTPRTTPPNIRHRSDGSYAAATVSSGPQPASLYPSQAAPVMLPPLHYQGLDAPQPFGYQSPPAAAPMMHPARVAALSGGVGVDVPPLWALLGMVRSADEMDGGEDGHPPAKRQKVAKLPGGQYYPEQDWINLHPHSISLQVRLPNDPSKPEYKLDGSGSPVQSVDLNTPRSYIAALGKCGARVKPEDQVSRP